MGTADLWPPNGIRVAAVRAGRREREQRAVRYAACATGWIPDFHSTQRQPATAAGVRGRGWAQVHGVNVNNVIRPTNVHTKNRYAANLSAAAAGWN